jgi:hypothetical protein
LEAVLPRLQDSETSAKIKISDSTEVKGFFIYLSLSLL